MTIDVTEDIVVRAAERFVAYGWLEESWAQEDNAYDDPNGETTKHIIADVIDFAINGENENGSL